MNLEFHEYRVDKILNIHKHVDGPWFWDKYAAHPYVGCQSGCEFCYCRGGRYLGGRDPETFDKEIGVKINAVERLRGEIYGLEAEIISVGDWQFSAENQYRLSRGMLEVVLEANFPLFIVERSPLLTRDLDLLVEINAKSWVGVLFSISSLNEELKHTFEPHSPGVRQRLEAMAELAEAGIQVGTAMMPIIPFIGDDEGQLEEIILATADHGGQCVLAGGLTMSGIQAKRTLAAAKLFDSGLESSFRELYSWEPKRKPKYSPPRGYTTHVMKLVRELCIKHGLKDRMPRYIAQGPLAINKRIAERLFLKTYDLELEQAKSYRIWAYRKAAWTVDELDQSLTEIYLTQGEAGLQNLPNIGKSISGVIAQWLEE
jgi:DNA repair photolyase